MWCVASLVTASGKVEAGLASDAQLADCINVECMQEHRRAHAAYTNDTQCVSSVVTGKLV